MSDTVPDDFSPIDVGLLVLDAVTLLHERGHQRLRVLPGVSPSGAYWRVNVTTSENIVYDHDYIGLRDWHRDFRWTTGDEYEISGIQVTESATPEFVAALITRALSDPGLGPDPAYAAWFAHLVDTAHRLRTLPIAYAENIDQRRGWAIGIHSGVYVPHPPRPPQGFSAHVAEKLGWYVYALRNPIDERVFYIGKGRGNRVFAHAQQAQAFKGEDELGQKIGLIKEIHATGRTVEAFIIRHGLLSEELAYEVEASLIDVLRLLDPAQSNRFFSLANAALGHNASTRGLASVEVVSSLYDAPQAPEINVPALLIKIPGLWTPTMTAHELYEATRQWWRLGANRAKAGHAFAINHGVIREVYRIDSWEPGWLINEQWTTTPQKNPADRWRFSGVVDTVLSSIYKNTSVKNLYKPGEANPVRYINCV